VAAARALYNAPSPSGPPVPTPDLKEAAMSDTLKAGLASLIIGGGIGAIGGVATPHLANLRSTVQDKMGQVVGVENAGNIERSKQEVRSQLGLGANTPATTRAAVGAGLGGLAGLIQSWRKRNAAPDAPHHNPLVHAAAQFLHKELGPLTWQKDESGKSTTDHPWHYSNRLSMALKDPMTTDVNAILKAAHDHIIGGHHNIGEWSYKNLPPEKTFMNHDDVDGIEEAGEELVREKLEDHLLGVKDQLPQNR